MRIVQLAHSEATITFVKVRSGAMHTSKGRDMTVHDEWLTVAGNDLTKLLAVDQDQADDASQHHQGAMTSAWPARRATQRSSLVPSPDHR
jgi:hypothetical protein